MSNYDYQYKTGILSSLQFLCCQPGYFSTNLNYREYHIPRTNPLYGVVSIFYEASSPALGVSIPIIPDGCVDLVFSFRDHQCIGVSICGTITSFYPMELEANNSIFGIRFMPGKFPVLYGESVEELINHQFDVKLTEREHKFIKNLVRTNLFADKISLATYYIGTLCQSKDCKRTVVEYSMQCICSTNGNVTIKELSNELVYSPRYIEQIFKEYTGFSPKSMCRLVRMHRAVLVLLWENKITSTTISMECGYSDLSHMNRDLNQILGMNSREINNRDFYYKYTKLVPPVYKF